MLRMVAIGSTINLDHSFRHHRCAMLTGLHVSNGLQPGTQCGLCWLSNLYLIVNSAAIMPGQVLIPQLRSTMSFTERPTTPTCTI